MNHIVTNWSDDDSSDDGRSDDGEGGNGFLPSDTFGIGTSPDVLYSVNYVDQTRKLFGGKHPDGRPK